MLHDSQTIGFFAKKGEKGNGGVGLKCISWPTNCHSAMSAVGDVCRHSETTLKGYPDNGDSVYKRTNIGTNQGKFIQIYRNLSQ